MEIIHSLEQLHKFSVPCVVALGTFDGLHRGHLAIIGAAKEQAQKTGAKLAVFTFSNHPFACFKPDKVPPALITSEQKQELLQKLGVDVLIDIPFDIHVANLAPEVFLQKLQKIGYSSLVVGSNFTYGIRGEGNIKTLAASAQELGFNLIVRNLVSDGETVISSTIIRRLIVEGNVAEANKMLGRNYSLTGIIAHGNERGRLLSFPTANIELQDSKQAVPYGGVYAVNVLVNGKRYQGMANIGKNPTFNDVKNVRLETHIFDFQQDIYGKQITVEFVERLRGEVKFTSIEKLKQQLAADAAQCRKILQ